MYLQTKMNSPIPSNEALQKMHIGKIRKLLSDILKAEEGAAYVPISKRSKKTDMIFRLEEMRDVEINNNIYKQKDITARKKLHTAQVIFNGDLIKTTYHGGNTDKIILENPVIQFVYDGEITQEKIKNGILEYLISYDVSGYPSGSYSNFHYKKNNTHTYQELFSTRDYEDGTNDVVKENSNINLTDLYEFQELTEIPITDLMKLPLFENDAPEYHSVSVGVQLQKHKCAINMLLTHLMGSHGFAKITFRDLELELGSNPCCEQICEYLEKKDVSYHIYDPMMNKIAKYISQSRHVTPIYALINNNHIYTITDEDLIKKITHGKAFLQTIRPKYRDTIHNISSTDFNETYEKIMEIEKLAEETKEVQNILINISSETPKNIMNTIVYKIFREKNKMCENLIGNPTCIQGFSLGNVFVNLDSNTQHVITGLRAFNPLDTIHFKNQSISTLANEIFKKFVNTESKMNSLVYDVFNNAYPNIPQGVLVKIAGNQELMEKYELAQTYDINKCYTACFQNRDEPLYFTSYLDEFVYISKYEDESKDLLIKSGGYFLIQSKKPIKLGIFDIAASVRDEDEKRYYKVVLRSNSVKYLLKENAIKYSQIKYYLKPTFKISQKVIDNIFQYIDNITDCVDLSQDEQKTYNKLIKNCMIGMLGRNLCDNSQLMLTSSKLFAQALKQNKTVDSYCPLRSAFEEDSLFIMSKTDSKKLYENNRPIYSDVLFDAIVRLYELYKIVYTPSCEILQYKTDSITVFNGNDPPLSKDIGGYKEEQTVFKEFFYHEQRRKYFDLSEDIEWEDISKYQSQETDAEIDMDYMEELIQNRTSFRLQAKGGYGKTTIISNIMKKNNIDCLGLALTRKVKTVLESKGIESTTFASLFTQHTTEEYTDYIRRIRNNIRNKYVVIDELGMVTRNYIEKLYEIWRKEKFPIILIGDYRQLPPPENNGSRNNFDLLILKQMCNYKMITLKHPYRCDLIIDEVSNKIHDTGIAENKFQKINEILEYNLAYTNNKVDEINKKCFEYFSEGKILDNLGLFPDCRIMSYCNYNASSINNEPYEINNSDTFRYKKNDNNYVYLTDDSFPETTIKIDVKEFKKLLLSKHFKLGYCSTIHKYQGSTISVPFNIYEVNKFDRKLAYTALTRATLHSNIHVDSWSENFRKTIINYETIDLTNTKSNFIYVLYHHIVKFGKQTLQIYYVGKTNNPTERLKQHQENIYKENYPVYIYMRENNIKNVEMSIVCSCSKEDVDDKEKLFIKQYTNAGVKLYNYQLNQNKQTEEYKLKQAKNPEIKVVPKGSIYIGENYIRFRYTQDKKQKEIKRAFKTEEEKKILEEKIKEIQKHYSIYGEILK